MNRTILKQHAKDTLSKFYWTAFLLCFIIVIVNSFNVEIGTHRSDTINYNQLLPSSMDSLEISSNAFFKIPIGSEYWISFSSFNPTSYIFNTSNPTFFLIQLGVLTLNLAIFICIKYVFLVGQKKFFIDAARGKSDMGSLVFLYRGGHWFSVGGKIFVLNLIIFLWSLLLIIPGIIKSLEYIMVPYILAESPDMPFSEATRLSSRMTNGYKADIFVLILSFIGWYLLGFILCCIGMLFVTPYYEATFAELYHDLKEKLERSGE